MTDAQLTMYTPGFRLSFTTPDIEQHRDQGLGIVQLVKPTVRYISDFATSHVQHFAADIRGQKQEYPFLHLKGGLRLSQLVAGEGGRLQSKTDLYLVCSELEDQLRLTIPVLFEDGTQEVDRKHFLFY